MTPEEKYSRLKDMIKELGRAAAAVSGGTDSALLACATSAALGDQAFAVTISSPLTPKRDKEDIVILTEMLGMPLIKVMLDETEQAAFAANPGDRCYLCKSSRLRKLETCAREWNIPWILDGSNLDDLDDYRPGMRAVAESKMTRSPLLECGFTKSDVRAMSLKLGLFTALKPASACLASRVPTGVPIQKELLAMIDAGEELLRSFTAKNSQVRLRFDGKNAVIETDPENIPGLSDELHIIRNGLSGLGFGSIVLSKEGYRTGSVTVRPK